MDKYFTRTVANSASSFLTDGLGSTIALTDPTGNSQVQYSYAPFGSIEIAGTTNNTYTDTGDPLVASSHVPQRRGPTKSACLGQALKSDGNRVSLALDVAGIGAGFLPGAGLVTGSASAATTAFAFQAGLTVASTATSVAYESGPGIIAGILGGQVALTAKSAEALAVDVGMAIPIVDVAVSTGALLYEAME